MRSLLLVLLTLATIPGCGPPARPAGAPGQTPSLPEGLAGKWHSQSFGIDLQLDEDGSFVWDQEGLHKEGWFAVEGASLVMGVGKGYSTSYALVELTPGKLTIRDPAGTTVVFAGEAPDAGPGKDTTSGAQAVAGSWSNTTFQLRIDLSEEGTFVWKQGSLVETGTYSVVDGAVHMATGGHTSTYRIAKLGEKSLVLIDPAGNELTLERVGTSAPLAAGATMNKDSLLGGKPTIKIVNLEGGASAPAEGYVLEPLAAGEQIPPPESSILGPGSLFHFTPPSGFKVDTQKVCGNKFTSMGKVYTCWNRNDLYAPDSSRLHFDIAPFVTWAAPGALEKLSPEIDGLLAGFDEDRTSVSDETWEMSGFEVFSTRITGRSGPTGKQLSGRIIGIHYGDLLIVGVLALSGDPVVFSEWGEQVEATLDSMSFYVVEGEKTASSVIGTWKTPQGGSLTLSADGKFVMDGEKGSWIALGTTLVLASGPAVEGTLAAYPVQVEGNVLNLAGVFYEKQI